MNFYIPQTELQFEAVRGSGPGGQHVNRTNSAVILRWSLWQTNAFSEEQKLRIFQKLATKLNSQGELLIRSEVHRSQDSNRKECVRKFYLLLKQALHVPKPRHKTKPTRGSVERRHDTKKRHAHKKTHRRKVNQDVD